MKLENADGDKNYNPLLTFLEKNDEVLQVQFTEFGLDNQTARGVPVKYIDTVNGKIPVTTVYDLTMAQYGVGRGSSRRAPGSSERGASRGC